MIALRDNQILTFLHPDSGAGGHCQASDDFEGKRPYGDQAKEQDTHQPQEIARDDPAG
jgi:hypothetical protein